jgi:O-antigen/teichoic acid export membrane protein
MLFTMGVSLYTSRVVLRTLGVEDFGIYNVVGGIVFIFGFLNITLAQGTQRFLTFQLGKNDHEELKKTFSAALIMHIILSLIIVIIAETIGLWLLTHKLNIPLDRQNAAFWVFQFSVFTSVVSIIRAPYNAVIIAHEKMNVYAFVSIIEVSLKLLIVYLLVIMDYDKLIGFAVLTFIVNLVVAGIYQIYCKKQYHESQFQIVTDRALYKSMCSFSGWLVVGMGFAYMATYGIDIILNIFFGPIVNAARAISVQVSNAVSAFASNFQTAINPNIVKLYAAGKTGELFSLILQNVKFSFCLMWLFFLPIFLKTEYVLKIWLGIVPEHTVLFCQIVLIQTLIACTFTPFFYAIQAVGKLRLVIIVASVLWIIALFMSYLSLKFEFPVYTPFIVCLLVATAVFFVYVWYFCRTVNLPLKRLIKNVVYPILLVIIGSLPVSCVTNYYFKDGLLSSILVSLVAMFSVLISVYYFAFSREMRRKIITIVFVRFHIGKRK